VSRGRLVADVVEAQPLQRREFEHARVRVSILIRSRSEWSTALEAFPVIGEVSHLAPPVAGAITAASLTTETASDAHAARLRRVLAKRHALPTINRGSCSARKYGHHQAFAGSQHLVGWR